jgi:macrolide-specific efflux system membrane fusion protein
MKRLHSVGSLLALLAAIGAPATAARAEDITIDSALLQLIEQVDVPGRAPGILSSVDVLEGDAVRAGMKLARLDDKDVKLHYQRAAIELQLSAEKASNQVAIRTAERALEYARAENDRMQRAAEGLPGSVSESVLEEAKFKLDRAKLDLEQAQHELRVNQITEQLKKQELALGQHQIELREVVSPVDGIVVEVVRHEGEWVEPGEKVIRIVRIDRLRAEGLIHIRHVTEQLKGAAATVSVAVPGQSEVRSTGQVVFVSPEVNPVNGLVRISVEFVNRQNRLRPGLRARITIPSSDPRQSPESTSRTDPLRR